MKITFSPVRRDAPLVVERAGDAILLNNVAFDLAALPEGAMLPAEAFESDWIAGPVERAGGVLHLHLFLPHGSAATEAERFPAPVTASADGPIALPGTGKPPRRRRAKVSEGAVDFCRIVTPADRQRAADKALEARIKVQRDRALSAGVTVGGVTVRADDRTQQRLQAAAFGALRDPGLRLSWKAADGHFVTLEAAQVIALADAVRAHVQACFDHEALLRATLAAGAPVDPAAGWPAGA